MPVNNQQINNTSWFKQNKQLIILVVLILLLALVFLILGNLNKKPLINIEPEVPSPIEVEEDNQPGNLPKPDIKEEFLLPSLEPLTDIGIEYLAFTDFYTAPDNDFQPTIKNYDLPINIKIDGINYYDLSRRLNLELGVSDLNKQGFAILNNPWLKEANNFYSIYEKLDQQQIPFLVTSDFIAYYYQNMMKKIFKEIEGQVFYQNLWKINLDLYEQAKTRYESNLASKGHVSDMLLEGQRMETAFFAVALDLLQAKSNQVVRSNKETDSSKFTIVEAEKFSINFPNYLRGGIDKEHALIKAARDVELSPNLLQIKNYSDFVVPTEYRTEARLNNFYLAAKWLNSVFPLYYKDDDCPECLLDQEDWRISMIAASLISQDITNNPEIKTRWARIYKLMSFFQGLREEVNYVHFRDALVDIFGEDYQVEELFTSTNPDSLDNLKQLKNNLLSRDYPDIRGALDKNNPKERPKIGFKVLADYYWPNDYIFKQLSVPIVGVYQGQKPYPITSCNYEGKISRCTGFSLDIINLVKPMEENKTFTVNANYNNYLQATSNLHQEFKQHGLWPSSNYWATLITLKNYLQTNNSQLSRFMQSTSWENKTLNTAIGMWVNLHLPLDDIVSAPILTKTNLNSSDIYNENIYIEPNLALVNEFIAINEMLAEMFEILQLKEEASLTMQKFNNLNKDLYFLKTLIEKELLAEKFSNQDIEALTKLIRQYRVNGSVGSRNKTLIFDYSRRGSLREDLSTLKLLAVVHEKDGAKVISIGPIWEVREFKQ